MNGRDAVKWERGDVEEDSGEGRRKAENGNA